MNNTQHILEELANYLTVVRQVGHTTAMIEGAKTSDCVIVSPNHVNLEIIRERCPGKTYVTLGDIPNGKLRGMNKPILFDNAALYNLFREAICEMNTLKHHNQVLVGKLKALIRDFEE